MILREMDRSFDSDFSELETNEMVEIISFPRLYHLYKSSQIFIRLANRRKHVLVLGPQENLRLNPVTKDVNDILLHQAPSVVLDLFPSFNFRKDCSDKYAFLARNLEFQCWELAACRSVVIPSQSRDQICKEDGDSAFNSAPSQQQNQMNAPLTGAFHSNYSRQDEPVSKDARSAFYRPIMPDFSLSKDFYSYRPEIRSSLVSVLSSSLFLTASEVTNVGKLQSEPNYPYNYLVTLALKNSPTSALSLGEICDFIR